MTKVLLDRDFDSEEINDVAEYFVECFNDAEIPVDNHGFHMGTFSVVVVWHNEDELSSELPDQL